MGNLGEELAEMVEQDLIGEQLSNGAIILKVKHQYDKHYLVLAFRKAKPHPFVVWNGDMLESGTLDASRGDYAETIEEALTHFERRAI